MPGCLLEDEMHPDDRKYHKEHCWALIRDKKAVIGISDHAQKSLGDIVYIELPELDSMVDVGDEIGEIESAKATADIISPLTGTITLVNENLDDSPESINDDPYENGWIAEIELSDPDELDDLMDSSDYARFVEDEN